MQVRLHFSSFQLMSSHLLQALKFPHPMSCTSDDSGMTSDDSRRLRDCFLTYRMRAKLAVTLSLCKCHPNLVLRHFPHMRFRVEEVTFKVQLFIRHYYFVKLGSKEVATQKFCDHQSWVLNFIRSQSQHILWPLDSAPQLVFTITARGGRLLDNNPNGQTSMSYWDYIYESGD